MALGHPLIDAAVKVCQSRYKVAQRLGVSEAYLSQVHRGKTPLSPKMAARLAALAGTDPYEAAALAIIDSAKDEEERGALTRLFSRTGAVAMLGSGIVAASLLLWPEQAADVSGRPHGAPQYESITFALYIM